MRDVVVVGGGPAGSSVAHLLAGQGWDVLLLDRARFPRDKPCGEFLTPAVRPLLEDLGVWPELRREGLTDVPSMKLYAPSGRVAEYRPVVEEPAGYAVRRMTLDRLLLGAARDAGVQVREGRPVRGVLAKGGVRVSAPDGSLEEISARLVIGADGTHSTIARSLGLVRPLPRLQRVAVVSHWSGLPGDPAVEMRSKGGLVCGVGALGGGTANVTVVARTEKAARIAGRPGEYLKESITERFPELGERLQTAQCEPIVRTVGCFGHVTRRATADRTMLVGDAATFVDPFTGEGVYFGLRGAELAAQVAHEHLRSNDLSAQALSAYDRLRKELKQRYLLCGVVQTVVRTPVLMERLVRRCGREPLTLTRLMEVLGDLAPPDRALRPGFALSVFR